MLRRALRPEGGTIERLQHTAQHVARAAHRGLRGPDSGERKAALGVELGKLRTHAQAAARDGADAAPIAVHQLEYLRDEILRRLVAVTAHRAHVLVFDLVPSLFELVYREQHALENVQRLEPGDDDRDLVLRRDRLVLGPSHDRADVTGREESL